jgi:N,N-dimethylformamidase beta subunit-like, C-terminal
MKPTIGRSLVRAYHEARREDAGVVRRARRRSVFRVITTVLSAGAILVATTMTLSRPKSAGASGDPVPAVLARSTADWVVQENQRPGTSAWRIGNAPTRIEGFADRVSAQVGARVRLFVSTPANHFHVEAYRFGWYGGDGARLVWRSGPVPGHLQTSRRFVASTRMVEAAWHPSLAFTVTPRWVQGAYLLLLMGSDGSKSYFPLTIRDDSSHADLVIQLPTTTWQAYNRWGGYSLYDGPHGYADRSYVVSFDRPYATTRGAPDFFDRARPLIALAERKGYDVTYWTDNDLDRRPRLLRHHRALITLGHDEYWSSEMRKGALRARAAGVNLAFLGSNADYRHIRLVRSPLGAGRHEIDYKTDWRLDPLYGVQNRDVTSEWRTGPMPRPESALNGGFYQCYPVQADMVVSKPRSWLFANTGASQGQRLRHLIRLEYDKVDASAPTPKSIQILAHTPVSCGGSDHSDLTYYTTRSKAGVVDTGTNEWIGALRCGFRGGPSPSSPIAWCSHVVVKATINLLTLFARGPAGRWHPSKPNVGSFGIHLRRPIDP